MEERQTMITLKNVVLSYRGIKKKVKVSVSTVSLTIKRHSETGANSDRKRSGRPKVAHRTTTSTSVSTVKRRLRAAGLTGQVTARKPLLRHQNKTKGLALAMKHHHWTTEDWKKPFLELIFLALGSQSFRCKLGFTYCLHIM
uniref:Transposase Tc1-like domain-containing protein n=1 Tax=Pundamilia nyererei TaxID=303518 RepID=A0A3B4FQA6_9CICH